MSTILLIGVRNMASPQNGNANIAPDAAARPNARLGVLRDLTDLLTGLGQHDQVAQLRLERQLVLAMGRAGLEPRP